MSLKGFRLRYSVRALLILLTAVAIWLGYLATSAKKQRDATAAIREMGGSVLYHYQISHGEVVKTPPPGPSWLRNLLGRDWFDTVIFVEFYNKPGKGTDEELASAISKLPRLDTLHLTKVKVGETTLKTISGMTQLGCLTFHGPNFTDDSLQYIYPLRKLRQLNLDDTKVTDAGVKSVQAAIPSVYISSYRNPPEANNSPFK
jgi:hypothetical protein